LDKLDKLGMIQEDDGARVIFVEGVNIPIIAVKRDGGYNYSSTDIAALWLVYTFSFLINKLIPIVWVSGSIQWLNFVNDCSSEASTNSFWTCLQIRHGAIMFDPQLHII